MQQVVDSRDSINPLPVQSPGRRCSDGKSRVSSGLGGGVHVCAQSKMGFFTVPVEVSFVFCLY